LQGKPKNSEKTCPSSTLSHHKSHMTRSGFEPRTAAVGSQRLTAWAMTRPSFWRYCLLGSDAMYHQEKFHTCGRHLHGYCTSSYSVVLGRKNSFYSHYKLLLFTTLVAAFWYEDYMRISVLLIIFIRLLYTRRPWLWSIMLLVINHKVIFIHCKVINESKGHCTLNC
jgi:hypothetical protein